MRRDQRVTSTDTSAIVRVTVTFTIAEAEALRDGAFTCTSPETHKAGRRALDKVRAAVAARHPRTISW